MAKNRKYTLGFKRKVTKKTNYKNRLELIKSKKIRIVIRPSLNNLLVQFVEYLPNGDHVLISIKSDHLKKLGWLAGRGNIPAAYLTGFYAGKLAKSRKIDEAILDMGHFVSSKGNRIYAALKGVIDAGINVPCSKEILPKEDAISGVIIANYAKKLSSDKEKHDEYFSNYIKNNLSPEKLPEHFKDIKNKIMNEVK